MVNVFTTLPLCWAASLTALGRESAWGFTVFSSYRLQPSAKWRIIDLHGATEKADDPNDDEWLLIEIC